MDCIHIKGAREHNLKNIDLTLPAATLMVITGLSGSGKSSLAFDTLYAEGQRRYVESLSAYARQFLDEMEKPDVDSIEGLSPAISIEQKTTSRNPRSTVATVTEIYDYLRLLYARVGKPVCMACGQPIASQTIQEMADQILAQPEGTRVQLLAPVVRGAQGRVPQAPGRPDEAGLHPGPGQRRDAGPHRGAAGPGQAEEAHHRGGHRPAQGQPRHQHRAWRTAWRSPATWPKARPWWTWTAGAPVLLQAGLQQRRVPALRPGPSGPGAPLVLLQLPLRGLPGLRRPGLQAPVRRGAHRAQPGPEHRPGLHPGQRLEAAPGRTAGGASSWSSWARPCRSSLDTPWKKLPPRCARCSSTAWTAG